MASFLFCWSRGVLAHPRYLRSEAASISTKDGTHSFWLFAQTGQVDRYIELFERSYVRAGAYGPASRDHELLTSDLPGDDPRYQALLEEAGITW